MLKVAPSILAADMLNMERDVQRMIDAGTDWLHVDIMDAHFVPNLSYSPALVEALHVRFPALPLDVHLMMDNPEKYIDVFCDAGASVLTIHAEIGGDVAALLRRIRARGVMAGLSVKPGTPAEAIRHLLPEADMVLVMTVEPGFGGQKFNADMLGKLDDLRKMGYTGLLEADGGVSMKNIADLRAHGLDVAVMGTAMLRSQTPAEDMTSIHALA
ncbi:MAG: ribulose-phosphate 3-epimerase [Clostridia bacterium]|nr:ribulose-phosphate 3-epimerase [Clostridia bacterium]